MNKRRAKIAALQIVFQLIAKERWSPTSLTYPDGSAHADAIGIVTPEDVQKVQDALYEIMESVDKRIERLASNSN